MKRVVYSDVREGGGGEGGREGGRGGWCGADCVYF